MPITIHRSSDPNSLIGALAEIVADTPDDPFTPEVIAVPTRGIERWIAQELSHRLDPSGHGIAANIRYPTLRQLISSSLAAVGKMDDDPWASSRLRWQVLETIEAVGGVDWLTIVTRYIAQDNGPSSRVAAASQIAGLYLRYQRDRPEMLRAWANGSLVDGAGQGLIPDLQWQAQLWREVRDRIGVPSPAERIPSAIEAILSGEAELDLPERVLVYGLTRLGGGDLETLNAIASTREVHVFLLHHSPATWDQGMRLALPDDPVRGQTSITGHPLNASWGRDAGELQLVLRRHGIDESIAHDPERSSPTSALSRIQATVRDDEWPAETTLLDPADRSLQIHSCHGPTRQVQVLRDTLLHVMSENPTIQPRDIVVMCPDIETYAPIVEAVFRRPDPDGQLPDLRVRVADRSAASGNPLAAAATALLRLVDGRLGTTEVLDFLALDPVQRGFAVSSDDLSEIASFVDEARIKWGLNDEHRSRWGLPPIGVNSWEFGLTRLLSGVFLPDTQIDLTVDTLPVPGIEGSNLGPLGTMAEVVARLSTARARLTGPMTGPEWHEALMATMSTLADTDRSQEWQWDHLARLLDDALPADAITELELADAITAIGDLSASRPSRSNHRTGQLTVCTLVPMRSVPHRVICLLGLDDGAFPRRPGRNGDDILDRAPRVGDRDPSSEDRQLLLDALMATGDHLIITYSGHDERTNKPLPPAVPIAELLDVIDRTFTTTDGTNARHRIVRSHPLQAFDPRVFDATDGTPWGFDPLMLDGAKALAEETKDPPVFLKQQLEPLPAEPLTLQTLVRFIEAPVRGFVQHRLGLAIPRVNEVGDDLIPVELDALQKWSVGDRLIKGMSAGHPFHALTTAEQRRGDLPPGELGAETLEPISETVEAIQELAREHDLTGEHRSLAVEATAPDGRPITGVVQGVYGTRHGVLQFSRVAAKHQLAAYVRLVALTASDPSRPWDAVVVGKASSGDGAVAIDLGPLGESTDERREVAATALELLLDLFDRGTREPLPIYTKTSHAFATAANGKSERAAEGAWATTWMYPDEDLDDYNLLVLGGQMPFESLLQEEPRRDEKGNGWPPGDSRFEVYARRLWDPIMRAMERGEA